MRISLAISPTAVLGSRWAPAALGASLFELWDAARVDTITQSGGTVSGWAGTVTGLVIAQATSSAQPVWGSSSLNGTPGTTFDGSDDTLFADSSPWTVGPHEKWLLVDQTLAPTDATSRYIFSTGGNTNATATAIRRAVPGVPAGTALAGAVTSATSADNQNVSFLGRHVVRAVYGPPSSAIVDGIAGGTGATALPTAQQRTVLGSIATAGGNYFQGVIAVAAITAPLSDTDAALFTTYLKNRGGIS